MTQQQTQQPKVTPAPAIVVADSAAAQANHESAAADRKHALAVATAEAAMATAQAAVEVARLTRPGNHAREHYIKAAIVIQTGFRGYLVSQQR